MSSIKNVEQIREKNQTYLSKGWEITFSVSVCVVSVTTRMGSGWLNGSRDEHKHLYRTCMKSKYVGISIRKRLLLYSYQKNARRRKIRLGPSLACHNHNFSASQSASVIPKFNLGYVIRICYLIDFGHE